MGKSIFIGINKPRSYHLAVGPCPHCGRLDTWMNDIPLRSFCWGPENKEHKEWSVMVPSPYNPHLEGYDSKARPPEINYEDRRPDHLKGE